MSEEIDLKVETWPDSKEFLVLYNKENPEISKQAKKIIKQFEDRFWTQKPEEIAEK